MGSSSNNESRGRPGARAPAPARRAADLEAHAAELQSRLEEAAERYRALCSFLPIPLLLLDGAGIIREANDAFSVLVGAGRGRPLGSPFSSFIVPGDRAAFRRHLTNCQRERRGPASVDLRLSASDGQEVAARLVSEPAVSRASAHWTAVLDRRAEHQLQLQTEAVRDAQERAGRSAEARDLFVAALSHELRSPIAAITAAASLIQSPPNERLDVPHLAGLISRAAAAQTRLVDDLHDLTNITRGRLDMQLVAVDLDGILGDAVETFAREIKDKSLSLDVELGATRHVVEADAVRLRQVFWNLVKNAIKFTPSGGRLGIRSWNREGSVVVEVCDSGVGIAPHMLERIFERFEQASRGSLTGLGLGLPIAKGIVEALRGRILVGSPGLGRGSRFQVELPTVDAAPAPEPAVQSDAPGPRRSTSVLLVEDDSDLAEVMTLVLERRGYSITTVDSVRGALAVDLHDIDVIVSDIELPDGSGRELLRQLHDRKQTPAIALSGFVTQAETEASKTAGFLAHLKKPVDLEILQAAIDAAARLSAQVHQSR